MSFDDLPVLMNTNCANSSVECRLHYRFVTLPLILATINKVIPVTENAGNEVF